MGECAIYPKVKNKDGQLVDSKLFKDLLSYTGDRGTAVLTYVWAIQKDHTTSRKVIKLDDNNQPTLESLHESYDLSKIVGDMKLISQAEKTYGMLDKKGNENTFISETKATDIAKKFNKESPIKSNYQALVKKVYTGDPGKEVIAYKVRVQRRDAAYSVEKIQQEYDSKLNSKLKTILSKFGISIGALTELEKKLGINGVMDTSVQAADGIIELIRLAEGIKGEKALPEEFAHFVFEK